MDVSFASGQLAFLSRILEIKKGEVEILLPLALNVILHKLSQDPAPFRRQAIELIRTMAESGHLKRHYIASWECVTPVVYRHLQV